MFIDHTAQNPSNAIVSKNWLRLAVTDTSGEKTGRAELRRTVFLEQVHLKQSHKNNQVGQGSRENI